MTSNFRMCNKSVTINQGSRKPFSEMGTSEEVVLQRIGDYDLCGKTLGKGSFARVELAIHGLTNTKVALKIIKLDVLRKSCAQSYALRESAVLKKVRHQNIIRMYETLVLRDTCCFVMEYLDGGDLLSFVHQQTDGYLTEKQCRNFFIQIVDAVKYLHSNKIVHRDLKMQNIMLTDRQKKIKLIDFGLSNFFDKDKLLRTRCGTPEYAAPELFDRDETYQPNVEVWSLGVILFVMATGKMPFQAKSSDSKDAFVAQIKRGICGSHEQILKPLTINLKNLLSQLLEPDKTKRLDLRHVLRHEWVTENGKYPVFPTSPRVVSHELRRKVIEKVAHLYNKTVDDTKQLLQSHSQDSIYATYHILLNKTLQFYESRGKSRLRLSVGKSTTNQSKVKKHEPLKKEVSTHRKPEIAESLSTCLQVVKKSPRTTDTKPSVSSKCNQNVEDCLRPKTIKFKENLTQHIFPSDWIATNSAESLLVSNANSEMSFENGNRHNTPVESVPIRVCFSSESGNFRAPSQTRQVEETPVRIHDNNTDHKQTNFRSVSPFEARKMLHRDLFPLKKTLMRPAETKPAKPATVHALELRGEHLIGKSVSEKRKKAKEHRWTHSKSDIIASIVSTPDALLYYLNERKKKTSKKSLSRCTLEEANEILNHEKKLNVSLSVDHVTRKDQSTGEKNRITVRRLKKKHTK